jgi:hypothetical protein
MLRSQRSCSPFLTGKSPLRFLPLSNYPPVSATTVIFTKSGSLYSGPIPN